MRVIVCVALGLLVASGLAGCGKGSKGNNGVSLKVTFLHNGKGYHPLQAGVTSVTLAPVGEGAKRAEQSTLLDDDTASAEFQGPSPGTYKIALSMTAPTGNANDILKGFAAGTTPLRYSVTTDGVQEIVVDLDAKTVTKK